MGRKIDTSKWTPEQLQAQRWFAMPAKVRQPKTQKELAAKIGVAPEVITRWKSLPGWQDAVSEIVRVWLFDDLPDVLKKLVTEAKKGSVRHQRLFLDALGWLVQKHEIAGPEGGPLVGVDTTIDLSRLSVEQLAALAPVLESLVAAQSGEQGTGNQEP
jgi:hypothetical protein